MRITRRDINEPTITTTAESQWIATYIAYKLPHLCAEVSSLWVAGWRKHYNLKRCGEYVVVLGCRALIRRYRATQTY